MVQDRVRDGRAGWLGERSIGQSPGYMGQLSKYWHMLADSKSKNSKFTQRPLREGVFVKVGELNTLTV